TRRLPISKVTLLATNVAVFRYKIQGRVKCRQSREAPLRTTSALVSAAKVMLMAARPTQIPVDAGGGAYSCAKPNWPPAGTRFLQPPLPESLFSRLRTASIFGGS